MEYLTIIYLLTAQTAFAQRQFVLDTVVTALEYA